MRPTTQKLLTIIATLGGIASLFGTYGYLPHRQDRIERIVEHDHDVLTRVETKVDALEKKLERNGIVVKQQNENQSSTESNAYISHHLFR